MYVQKPCQLSLKKHGFKDCGIMSLHMIYELSGHLTGSFSYWYRGELK